MKSLVIDKGALRANLSEIKSRAGSAEIVADLSGDGQGVGLVRMARFLREEGLGFFAVSETRDAVLLRSNGFAEERILMLPSITDVGQLQDLMDAGVIFTIGSYEAGIALNGLASERSTVAEARVRIDTGLGQYGFLPGETDKILNLYRHMPGLAITGLYAHLSGANIRSATEAQYASFMAAVEALRAQGVETGVVQALDSAALLRCELGEQAAICVGAALVGRLPLKSLGGLTRVGVIEAPLEEITWLDKGVRIGMGSGVELKKPTRVAVLDVGWYHGVGVLRESDRAELRFWRRVQALFSQGGEYTPEIRVRGKRARLLGKVGMAALTLDVTKCECGPGDVAVIEADPRMVRGLPVELRG